jgi:hypothetical protein
MALRLLEFRTRSAPNDLMKLAVQKSVKRATAIQVGPVHPKG